jgi:hypothetical protein
MKPKLLIILLLAFIASGCADDPPAELPPAPPEISGEPIITTSTPPVTTTLPVTTTPPVTTPPPEPDISLLKPLELLGSFYEESDRLWVDGDDWEECDPDVFREYMFGTWENPESTSGWFNNGRFSLDDSEETLRFSLQFASGYLRRGDTIIFYCSGYAEGGIFWLDINEPNIIYHEGLQPHYDDSRYWFPAFSRQMYGEIKYLTKTDMPINEPQDGFMSRLRLHELMRDYGIDSDMIFRITHEFYAGENFHSFQMTGGSYSLPIYLISEEPDKLIFKSSLICDRVIRGLVVDVVYTIEKIDDEWTRTVEFDWEQFENISLLNV